MKPETKKKVKKYVKVFIGSVAAGVAIWYIIDKRKPRQWVPKGLHLYDTDDRRLVCNETVTDKQYIGGKQETVSASNQHLRSALSKVDDLTVKTSIGVKGLARERVIMQSDVIDFLVPKEKLNGTGLIPTPPKEMHVGEILRVSCGQVCEDQRRLNTRSLRDFLTGIAVGVVNGIERGDISYKDLGKAVFNLSKTAVHGTN